MKIKALNEPDTSTTTSDESFNDDGKPPALSKAALEDDCFEIYRQALLAIKGNRKDEAKELLEKLLENLEDFKKPLSETIQQLKFSVLKNLGDLSDDWLRHYSGALDLDPTDISLWIKTGDRCMKSHEFSVARDCFEQALALNPNNWIAIDRLMELYYILHLPLELYDICSTASALNSTHKKATLLLQEAKHMLPSLDQGTQITSNANQDRRALEPFKKLKRKHQDEVQDALRDLKRAKLCITLDTARTQSLSSFGNYIIKIFERFSKQCITRNTMIDITINNTSSFSQQFNNGSINSQSVNPNSSDPQTITCSQDIEMATEGEGASNSENDKAESRMEQTTTSYDDNDQTKSNGRSRTNTSLPKGSSLSFAAMLFPTDPNDKRRSSRNRSNQDDTFSFKAKFDELNELLPECLRIGAIEQALQKRREEQMMNNEQTKGESSTQDQESISVETNLDPVREDLIIKDVISDISGQTKSSGSTISNIKLCEMFFVYLSKLAVKKQNSLPEAFIKIYKFYRRLCPLPTGVFIEIGPNGVRLDELWFTLTANEITYRRQDCAFLLRILEQLQLHLEEAQHKEFMVRLFLVLGLNLDYKYLEIALQNIEEDTRVYASNRKIITRAHIKTLIDRQTEKLQQEATVNESDNSLEIIERLGPKSENEMSDREINLLCGAIQSAQLWQRGLDTLNQRNDLNSDVIIETMNICLKNGAEMDAILASKLCKEALTGNRPTTWTCLYRGWLSVINHSEPLSKKTIRDMDKFFDLGHQNLGKKNVCTSDKGEFLMLHVEHLLYEDRDSFEERDLLGSLYCLFGYPLKAPAAVIGHKATRVPILWKYGEIIYDYLIPEELPTYMSVLRKAGLTSELEPPLLEIAEATPDNLDPRACVDVIENFIEKGDPLTTTSVSKNEVTQHLYYFLADYYFKNKNFKRAKRFYNYDLVINPDRFDSWAASGLIRASAIDKVLTDGAISTEDFVNGSTRRLADSAIRCFEQATKLKPNEPKATLWIEFGNLTYNLMSLASRLYIYDDFELELEGKRQTCLNELVERHKNLHTLSQRCFMSANQLCASDEAWLHYYMLGKIFEKADPLKALDYYHMADAQLFEEGASYPKKISYHNPPDLAYEAMEIHYRIHSAALKYILFQGNKTQDKLDALRRSLVKAQRSPFVVYEGVADPKDTKSQLIDAEVRMLLDDTLDELTRRTTIDDLTFMCLHGLKRCLVRSDKNFKALYRLSHYYRNIGNPAMAQDILFSRLIKADERIEVLRSRRSRVPRFMRAPPDLTGIDSLFKDKKLGNLYFNIWRMPIDEIDRPGSFEHWMFKCTWQLINTCNDLNDTTTLTTVAFQLSRQPETSKRYLQDRPRVLLALFAVRTINDIITRLVDKAESIESRRAHLREGILLADKFVKSNVFADKMRKLFDELNSRCLALTTASQQ